MKEKKLFIIGAILVVLGLILSYFFLIKKGDNKESGAEKFKSEIDVKAYKALLEWEVHFDD